MMKQITGYFPLHKDPNTNFQLNRWLPYLPEEELRKASSQIVDLPSFKSTMLDYARTAEEEGRIGHAAFYYRGAEFFALNSDPDKALAYEKFQTHFSASIQKEPHERDHVPFKDGFLPVLTIPAVGKEVETLVVHGGFDSFIEEFFWMMKEIANAGFRVIMFEGPGQGGALNKHGLHMTSDWAQPVSVVLDHMKISSCTLLGISLGGCLALRAAAHEPRIKRVILDDILTDFFGVLAHRLGSKKAKTLGSLIRHNMSGVVNRVMSKAAKQEAVTAWALEHGQHVSGTTTPFEYVKWAQTMVTKNISHLVTQDVLILAGNEDHLIPLEQFYDQQKTLTNARSITARLFTAKESAGAHCHVGNQGLVRDLMCGWIKERITSL